MTAMNAGAAAINLGLFVIDGHWWGNLATAAFSSVVAGYYARRGSAHQP